MISSGSTVLRLDFDIFSIGPISIAYNLSGVTGLKLDAATLAGIFQGFEDAAPNAWFNLVLNPGLFVLFVVAFLEFHLGFTGALVAYVLASAVSFAALAVYTARRLPRLLPPLL